MTAALALLAALAGEPSRTATGIALAVFGLGFGMVGQVLIVAVQNSVERRELGVATATTGFFRALGGAVGAAVLGAVFAARSGRRARADVVDAVQTVFLVAAPIAALALRRRARGSRRSRSRQTTHGQGRAMPAIRRSAAERAAAQRGERRRGRRRSRSPSRPGGPGRRSTTTTSTRRSTCSRAS